MPKRSWSKMYVNCRINLTALVRRMPRTDLLMAFARISVFYLLIKANYQMNYNRNEYI